jgi:acyl-CoA reductase-like NAD-dependent aldehyde dehydrogenase
VLNVIYGDAKVGEALVTHPGIDLVNFTASNQVGARIVAIGRVEAGDPRVGRHRRDRGACRRQPSGCREDVHPRGVRVGQSCVSPQRLYVHRSVVEAFLEHFLPLVDALRVGDPIDPQTDLSPMVSEEPARRRGALLSPTVLTDARWRCAWSVREVFGPIVTVLCALRRYG